MTPAAGHNALVAAVQMYSEILAEQGHELLVTRQELAAAKQAVAKLEREVRSLAEQLVQEEHQRKAEAARHSIVLDTDRPAYQDSLDPL